MQFHFWSSGEVFRLEGYSHACFGIVVAPFVLHMRTNNFYIVKSYYLSEISVLWPGYGCVPCQYNTS
jgi:hypothetical protein